MANFTTPPLWTNEGTAPSETLKTNGFQAGYKPPAPVFNYMFNKYGICLTELQTEANKKVGKSLAGQTVSPTKGKSVVAHEGAEIFNDYRERTYLEGAYAKQGNVASGMYSSAFGMRTTASGDNSFASGTSTKANGYQFVTGKYNAEKTGCTSEDDQSTDNSLFIVGYGTSIAPANALRITAAGKCYGSTSFGSSGADYAEYFEWQDGNKNSEDRRGLFVTLDGDKIRLANGNDSFILGVISANPSVVGDVQSENWHGMYKKDVFGQTLTETVEIPESTDEKTGEVIPAHTITRLVVNPDYNPDEEYTSREFRKEWACVGLMGKLIIVDDGTCEVNGYCKVADGGKATKADTGYRVMKRLDDTHIQILYR